MRQMRCARVEDGGGLFIRRIRVRDGDAAFLRGAAREVNCARKLGRHVHDAQQPLRRVVKARKGVVIGQAQIVCVLRAFFLFGKERTLHLDAHEMRTVRGRFAMELYRRAESRFQHVVGQRHRRGSKARHAVLRKIARHFCKAGKVAVGKVRAGIAVRVDIHKAGDDERAVQIRARFVRVRVFQHAGKAPVFDRKAAADELPVHKE